MTMGSDGYYHPNSGPQAGKDLTFTISTTSGQPVRAQIEQLFQADMKAIGIKINIHAAVFSQPDRFTDAIMSAAAEADVPLQRIVLEITEQAPLPDVQRVEALTSMMRSAGLRFAFDDLGLAYSHLRAIAAVRPSYLKISQHFGTGCESDEVKRKIVENIDALARSFSSEIVLEGIETAETAAFARDLGIRFGQGFYYSRPTNADILISKYGHS